MPTPQFILELRRHIGNEPLWLSGATLVVLREGETGPEVLLGRRADDGNWAAISGIVEPGENPADTVVREAREEACIEVEVERMLWLDVMDEVIFPNGDRCRFLDHGFRGRLMGGSPGIGDGELSDFGWFPVDQLPSPRQTRLAEQVRICLEDPRDVVLGLGSR